jgi:signal transduction histidine kinase
MFRRRLTIALAVLAAAAVAEGLLALWTAGVAERQVQRGRVASDIQLGFVELSATKQRLRGWVAQTQMDAAADPEQRDRLQADLQRVLEQLRGLSRRAIALDDGPTARVEHVQRQDALDVLAGSFAALRNSVEAAQPLQPGTDAREAWARLSNLFDMSNGRDLRQLLAESIAREAGAVERERAAADAALRWTRALWALAAATLALGALLLAWHFARALRRPLDELSVGVQALQRGELQHRIAAGGADEFSAVARSLNAMAAELAEHRDRESQARLRLEELVQARTAELEDALRALQQVDARRRQLFADISHELRTPTTAIRGEAEVTLRGREKAVDEYKAALHRIVDSSRQLSLVIDDLLTMARSDIDALAL